MRLKYGMAVAGSHGKTTTTSMVAAVLDKGGLDPTVVVGGRLQHLGSGARLGSGESHGGGGRRVGPLLPEALPRRGRRHQHRPRASRRLPGPGGRAGRVRRFRQQGPVLRRRGAVPGRRPGPARSCRASSGAWSPSVSRPGPRSGPRRCGSPPRARPTGLPPPARRSARSPWRYPAPTTSCNSLAAVGRGPGPRGPLRRDPGRACQSFTGVDRRFQVRGEAGGVLVIDDYGHHPTEIRATLETLRARAGRRRTVVLFQPHRFTRTQLLWEEFCRSFDQADVMLAY